MVTPTTRTLGRISTSHHCSTCGAKCMKTLILRTLCFHFVPSPVWVLLDGFSQAFWYWLFITPKKHGTKGLPVTFCGDVCLCVPFMDLHTDFMLIAKVMTLPIARLMPTICRWNTRRRLCHRLLPILSITISWMFVARSLVWWWWWWCWLCCYIYAWWWC